MACNSVNLVKYGKDIFEISSSYICITIPSNEEVLINYNAISGANREEFDDKEKVFDTY